MNYKSIVSSRKLRVYILTFFNWIPNEIMLRVQYRMQTGRKLNLKNAQRFTEKIQIYKLRYHNPSMLRCTDKYEVRKYIKEKGLELSFFNHYSLIYFILKKLNYETYHQ